MAAKHIFVTGGVVSSLGKGLTASSLGMLLSARGLRVVMQKLDPYLNVDPGTMNPFQHGEVFVTEDGGECDLDIGHYERFLNRDLPAGANVTTGQVYSRVIERERAGEYQGATVQVVPHITDEIAGRILGMDDGDVDVVITEAGGTIGDIEGLPFLEAIRQVRHHVGRENSLVVHVALIPYLPSASEQKTKPAQHSVAQLRQAGITPDVVVLRSDRSVPESLKAKVALMCDVDARGVVSCPDAPSLYRIPRVLHAEGLDAYVVQRLGLPFRDVDWAEWDDLMDRAENPEGKLEVAIIGKYIDLPDAYLSVIEAVRAGGFANRAETVVRLVAADDLTDDVVTARELSSADAIVIPGGFGQRAAEGKMRAIRYARVSGTPVLGICLGMQLMVVEAARSLLGIEDASSTEFDPGTTEPVICTMEEQRKHIEGGQLGGTMRLGSYPAVLRPGSVVAGAYGATEVTERHRHRYEVNMEYAPALEKAGLVISGTSPDGQLAEFAELAGHPFFAGCQGHPEYKSRPVAAHPLFRKLIEAGLSRKAGAVS